VETFGVEDMSLEVFETLSLLQPYAINENKLRLGAKRDGGYVVADFPHKHDLLSFGIANDVRFEIALAERGHRCFLFYHTIEKLPAEHPNFVFQKIGLGADSPQLRSLEEHVGAIDHSGSLLLKLDVEGYEWEAIAQAPIELLARFDQIVGEFHWLLRLNEPAFREIVAAALRNINKVFTLFNVHANNCRPLGFVGGFAVADTLELSFVKTELIVRKPSQTIYPDQQDMANNHAVSDHPLLFFPFLPSSVPLDEVRERMKKIAAEKSQSAFA